MDQPLGAVAVALRDVTIAFADKKLLAATTFSACAGEIVAIRGPNGSGKTSLLRLIANVTNPQAGTRTGPASCAYVPSTIDPLPVRAGDWLRLLPRPARTDPREILHQLDFDSDLSKKMPDLSFGNLRKLLLAEAFSSGEPLLVVDELTAGLDRQGASAVNANLRRLARAGATVVVADQQDRALVAGASVFEIADSRLVEVTHPSAHHVAITLQGPHAELGALLSAAHPLGFEASS